MASKPSGKRLEAKVERLSLIFKTIREALYTAEVCVEVKQFGWARVRLSEVLREASAALRLVDELEDDAP